MLGALAFLASFLSSINVPVLHVQQSPEHLHCKSGLPVQCYVAVVCQLHFLVLRPEYDPVRTSQHNIVYITFIALSD